MLIATEKLKKLRTENGWSQEILAKVSGLSCRTIQRIENDGKASSESVLALTAVFNISPQQLVVNENDITVNWTKKVIVKNACILAVASLAILTLIVLATNVNSYHYFVSKVAATFIVCFSLTACILTFGLHDTVKALKGTQFLFSAEIVGGKPARHLSVIYPSLIKFVYAGALLCFCVAIMAFLINVDGGKEMRSAFAFQLNPILYALILCEGVLRPLSLKLKHCDTLS